MYSIAPLKIQVRQGPRYCGLKGEHANIPIVKLRAIMTAILMALKPWRKKIITIEKPAKNGTRWRLPEGDMDNDSGNLGIIRS
jgi:hypothetical protein